MGSDVKEVLEKSNRYLRLKNVHGKSVCVVREVYRREVVPCQSQLCLSGCPNNMGNNRRRDKSSGLLPKDVTHYVIPDPQIARDYLEIFEDPVIRGVIFTQTAVHSVQHEGSRRLYNRLKNLVRDKRKESVIFHNEFQVYAHCEREPGEDLHQWQVRATYQATDWFFNHLAGIIPVVMVTKDKKAIEEYGNKTVNVFVLSMEEYLEKFWQFYIPGIMELYKSITEVLANKTKESDFVGYLPFDVLTAGIKSGRFVQGFLQVNKSNASQEAFLRRSSIDMTEDSRSDILIPGSAARNRGIHGDLVAVEILPKSEWKGRSLVIHETTQDKPKSEDGSDESKTSQDETSDVMPTGRVMGIIQRNWREYVACFSQDEESGRGDKKAGKVLVIPWDFRIPKIRISTRQVDSLRNHRFIVRIDHWESGSQYPNGHFVRSLGQIGDLETEIKAILVENDISVPPFSEAQTKQLPSDTMENPWKMSADDIKSRRDLRDTHLIFSIDPKGCEDVDDTLSVREELNDLISSTISNECSSLCGIGESESSVLQNVDAQQLLSLDFNHVHKEWKSKSPLFNKVVESAVSSKPVLQHNQMINMVVAGSTLLRSRNQKMSAISHIVGLLHDYGGANDETIHRMNHLGICVSPDSVYLKKKEISKLHDQQVEEILTDYKKTHTDIRLCKNMLKSIEELDLSGRKQDEASAEATNNTTAVITESQTETLDSNDIFVKDRVLFQDKVCYTNPLLPKQPTASLVTKVSDIEIISKYTERVDLSTPCKDLLFKSISLPNPDFSDIVCTSLTDVENTRTYTEQFAQQNILKAKELTKTEIYGDNCDLRVNRSHQSKDKKAKDFHWFLSLAAVQRVSGCHLADTQPQRPITQVPNQEFIPSIEENHELLNCFAFHVQRVLVENIKCLEIFKKVLAPYIVHSHINDFRKKSEYFLIDLHDKNESKNEDMIDILTDLQKKCVPYTDTSLQDKNNVVERKVFGGDVLTNERAYQAQLDMANGETESEKLMSFIHRPEGLHRLMNLLKYIFDTFYLTSSVNEQGTMYQLKCMLDRRDVKVDMTSAYRQCKNFFDDILDGHIVAAACHYFGMKDQYALPTRNRIPLFIDKIPNSEQLDWITNVAKSILDIYVMEESTAVPDIYEDTEYMATQMASLTDKDDENRFRCPHTDCPKAYKQFHWLKRHLKNKHNITVNINPPMHSQSLPSAKYDGIYNVASAFMKVGLLFRDTDDAFRMGDGNRLLRNAKFELLHFHQGHHIKYRLWMWRVLAYYTAILSAREAYEYKWNMSFNIGRGIGHLIPNDNLVEINVHLLKDQCRKKMGANVTFEGCRKWVKCLKYLHDLSETVDVATKKTPKGGKHTKSKRDKEIALVVQELVQQEVFEFTPNREHASFPNFSSDLLASVDTVQLNQWMNRNKTRAAKEMQI